MDFFSKIPFLVMWVIDVQASKIENNPALCNFIPNIASWKISKWKRQSKEHQTTFSRILKCVGLCTVLKCVDKNSISMAHASTWLFIKAKLKEFSIPIPITERASRWQSCSKESSAENRLTSLQLGIQFPILLCNTVPCRRRLSKQNAARPSHTSCRCLPNQAGIPQRDRRWKASPHHRVTASTWERLMIGFLKFPGPSKMSNIDSFVT